MSLLINDGIVYNYNRIFRLLADIKYAYYCLQHPSNWKWNGTGLLKISIAYRFCMIAFLSAFQMFVMHGVCILKS